MSVVTSRAAGVVETLTRRRSVRRLEPGSFSPALLTDLAEAADCVPSAFDAQPWQVVILHERHEAFWDLLTTTIDRRLEGERRDRYLARAAGMRPGGMTLLVFEDVARTAPQDNLSVDEARDQASQSLGMLQLALWLVISAHELVTSLQHWQWLMEDVALRFTGLPADGYRLVTFMPVGLAAEPPEHRALRPSRLEREYARPSVAYDWE